MLLQEVRKKLTNILKILFFVYIEHVKFQEASFNSSWDIKQWNNKNSGSIPSPHPGHADARNLRCFESIPSPHWVHSYAIILKWP